MKNANQFCLALTAAFFFALLATPMSAQIAPGSAAVKPTSTTSTSTATTTPTTSVDQAAADMKTLFTKWEASYNAEKSAELAKHVAKEVTVAEPGGATQVMSKSEFVGNLENDFIDAGKDEIDLTITSVVIQPDGKVMVVGTYTDKELDAKGNVIAETSGDFIDVVSKEDGAWKISEITVVPDKN
ncbi:MAG: nuclear transport factor 2 family protein [Saprospiraceae bacterium]